MAGPARDRRGRATDYMRPGTPPAPGSPTEAAASSAAATVARAGGSEGRGRPECQLREAVDGPHRRRVAVNEGAGYERRHPARACDASRAWRRMPPSRLGVCTGITLIVDQLSAARPRAICSSCHSELPAPGAVGAWPGQPPAGARGPRAAAATPSHGPAGAGHDPQFRTPARMVPARRRAAQPDGRPLLHFAAPGSLFAGAQAGPSHAVPNGQSGGRPLCDRFSARGRRSLS